MNAVFIAGTDTGVGKTIVTGLLGWFLLKKGIRVITQKWVQTGSNNFFESDVYKQIRLMRLSMKDIKHYIPLLLPYSFKFPSSPHLSSRLERKRILTSKIRKSFEFLKREFDFIIVEGTGGALVPLTGNKLLVDLVKEMELPVIAVAQNKIGAINHTLLTIEALRSRQIKIIGVIFNNVSKKEHKIILADNPKVVQRFIYEKVLGTLPYTKSQKSLYNAFIPIGNEILKNYINILGIN